MELYSYENEFETNEVPTREEIFPSTTQIILGFFISLFILIIFEKIFFSIFLYFIPSYILLTIILIIIHLFLLRYVIYICILPGGNIIIDFYIRTILARIRAKTFSENLEKFQNKIDKIIESKTDIIKEEQIQNNLRANRSKVSLKYSDIYEKMREKYGKLNSYEENFWLLLKSFKDKIENSSFQEKLGKYYRKEFYSLSEKDLKDYKMIKDELKMIQKILQEFYGEERINFISIFKKLQNLFFNNILGSKEFIRVNAIMKKPNSKEFKILNKENKKIDCLLIYSENKIDKNWSSNLVIVCGPNLTPFENLINSWDIDNLYLYNDTDILFWNYRGFGFSEGSANFSNICEDILEVYDYVIANCQYNKIAVHGLSIGGVPACYLAKERNINLLIADRTFGSVDEIVSYFPLSKILKYLYKLLFITPVNNSENFMKSNCQKILLNDAEDKTIVDKISLKTSIARTVIYKIFNETNLEFNIRKLNSYNILDYFLGPEEAKEFYKSFEYTINFLIQKKQKNSGMFILKLSEKEEKLNERLEDNIDTDNRKINDEEILDLFYNKINSIYSNHWCVGDSFIRFAEYQNNQLHFNNFFNNLVIYGSNDKSLAEYSLCNIRYTQSELNNFIKELNEFLNNEDIRQHSELIIYKNLYYINECLKKLKIFLLELHLEEKEEKWIKEQKGILIPLYCGHILFYDDKEFDTLKYLVKNALTNYEIIVPSSEK